MITSFSQFQYYNQYREAVIKRLEYMNSGQRLTELEEYNRTVKVVEKGLWDEINTYDKKDLQAILHMDFEKAAERFDWVELELITQLYFRLKLNLESHFEAINKLIEKCIKKLMEEKYTDESAVNRQLTEYFIEVLAHYPLDANFQIIKGLLSINIPEEYENDFVGLFRKTTFLAYDNQTEEANEFLHSLKTHKTEAIRNIAF